MTAAELARVVQEMRSAQKEYFRTRSDSALRESKQLEAKLDRCCQIVLAGQKELFPEEPPQQRGGE